MKLYITAESETVFTVKRHYDILRMLWRCNNFSADAIIGYLKAYHPEIDFPIDRDYHHLAFRLAGQSCQLSDDTCARVLEYIITAYDVDVNSVSFDGSPLVLYAIQSRRTKIVDLLVSKGARLTCDGHGIKNIYDTISDNEKIVDIPYCVKNDSAMRACVAGHMFNEVVQAQ